MDRAKRNSVFDSQGKGGFCFFPFLTLPNLLLTQDSKGSGFIRSKEGKILTDKNGVKLCVNTK